MLFLLIVSDRVSENSDPKCGVQHTMPKQKVHSGAAKRFKKSAAGFKRKSAFKSHILTKMTTKRKRQLRGTSLVNASDVGNVKRMLRLN